jgi:hypothetical protein
MKCSICQVEGHTAANKKFHPHMVASSAPDVVASSAPDVVASSAPDVVASSAPDVVASSSNAAPPPTYSNYLCNRTQDFLKDNDKEIIAAAKRKDSDLIKRIENFRRDKLTLEEQTTQTVESILHDVCTNTIIRAHFRKDPTRQSIHEITQIEWISKNLYPDAKKLPSDHGGIYFCKNAMCSIFPRPVDATKTIDIHSPSSKMYGILKYSTTAGGAQDNQFRDVKHFIHQIIGYFAENLSAEETFVCYLDGPYYTDKKRKELIGMIPDHLQTKICIASVEEIKIAAE